MIGILLITHMKHGEALIENVCHVLNQFPPFLDALGVFAADDPEKLQAVAKKKLNHLDSGAGILLLTDIFGATPSNIACKLLEPGRVEGLAGVNLPMLLRAINYRTIPLADLLTKAHEGGQNGIFPMTAG